MNEITTTDLSKFGYRELDMAGKLLQAYAENPTSVDMTGEGIQIMMNFNSGMVFLTNDEYQVVVLDDEGKLAEFYNCPECGYEGTEKEALEDEHSFLANEGYCSPECYGKNN